MNVITRMPPSPTGHLHIGTVRTALFNYLFAKQHNGTMLLRSEDTDQTRSTKEYETEIIDGLHWLGLEWDNPVICRQSERTALYRGYLETLIAEEKAYLSEEESVAKPGETVTVVRLKNPNQSITFTDLIRGDITFDTTELGDIVIARSLDDALYHFVVVVDDMEMGITHVLRGEDHISNTPRQILIQEAIGAPRPAYAHLPLILAADKSKLSKRHGAVALKSYIAEGFLKEAILNYLALLGWNPGTEQEFFTLDGLVAEFSLEKMHHGGAVFDRTKFLSINKHYLAEVSDAEFLGQAIEFLPAPAQHDAEFVERFSRLLPELRERISVYSEISSNAANGEYDWLETDLSYDTKLLHWKKDDSITAALPRLLHSLELLSAADFASPEKLKQALWSYAEEVGKGELLWPLRVALTGKAQSPDPFTCAYALGHTLTHARIQAACDKIAE